MRCLDISELKESAGEDFDKINALGELYEFDQQHEQAREQYRKALSVLDKIMYQRLGHTVSTSKDSTGPNHINNYHAHKRSSSNKYNLAVNLQSQPETQTIIRALLSWDENELENLLWAVPWGVRRIRLMLQIGMSFELAQDYERAKAHYIDARSLASAFFQLYKLLLQESNTEKLGGVKGWRLTVLKDMLRHTHLLYQPFLAEAWVGEKMVEVINGSTVLLESELLRLRRTLPFVSQYDATFDEDLRPFVAKQGKKNDQYFSLKNFGGGGGSSFGVLLAELHNKAGDLYFYKGYQFKFSSRNRDIAVDKRAESKAAGYILRAHFHYAFALHELRRHNFYDKNISKYKYTLPRLSRAHVHSNTIPSGQWALIIYQTLFNTLKDLADVNFIRGSLFGCWNGLPSGCSTLLTYSIVDKNYPSIERLIYDYGLYNEIVGWLEKSDRQIVESVKNYVSVRLNKKGSDIDLGAIDSSKYVSTQCLCEVILPLFLGIWRDSYKMHKRKLFNRLMLCKQTHETAIAESDLERDNYLQSLEFGQNSTPWQRLIFGLLCARTSADFIAEAGNSSEAAYELLLFMERIHHVVHGFRIINWLNNNPLTKLDEEFINLSALLADNTNNLATFSDQHANFICFIAVLAEECVAAYEKQAWLSWRRRPVAQADNNYKGERESNGFCFYKLNDAISPMAATTLVSILLDLQHFVDLSIARTTNVVNAECKLNEKLKATKSTLDEKLRSWLGDKMNTVLSEGTGSANGNLCYRNTLIYILKRHQYPVLNQLHALKALCNDIALSHNPSQQSSSSSEDGEMLRRYLEDMRILDENYAAPMHFTPYAYAESAALAVLSGALNSTPYHASRMHRRALEKLQQARSAYTMGKQYYSNIRRMYYLYDDFNDRRMHANHALLMSSMEIASILEALLSEKELLQSAIAGSLFIRESDRANSSPTAN